jgi:hypothetical protein
MKKSFLLAIFSLFAFAFAVSAQTPNFSGTWNLDLAKSKLGDRNNIESQTLTVTQTAADITVATATKRTPPPADGAGGGRPGGGGRGGFGGGDGTTTYKLDGSETSTEVQNQMGSMTVKTKGKIEGGKLAITRTATTPMGDRTSTESWELGADGNSLTITSTRPNRDGGTDTTTRAFVKKS